jgi:hypothetical protein
MKALLITGMLLTSTGAVAQDRDLNAARELYASAAYDDALACQPAAFIGSPRASRLPSTAYAHSACWRFGRSTDAEQAVETIIAAEPHSSRAKVTSPRIRSALTSVRRRCCRRSSSRNARVKAAFDRKESPRRKDSRGC